MSIVFLNSSKFCTFHGKNINYELVCLASYTPRWFSIDYVRKPADELLKFKTYFALIIVFSLYILISEKMVDEGATQKPDCCKA